MRYLFFFLLSLVVLSSCKVMRSNMMLKTPHGYVFDQLVDSLSRQDYKIAVNDQITFQVFANKGFKLIDLNNTVGQVYRNDITITVESEGYAKVPLLGKVSLAGLTIREAELFLEKEYSEYYVDPFVGIKVNNKRVIVFPGNGGLAKVLPLANNNTSVMEALASAGGIMEDGKAYKVKLIRNNLEPGGKTLVYKMDLSTIEGIAAGKSIVQAGDIIYVEPRYRPIATFNQNIAPLLTLLASVLVLIQLIKL